MANYRIGWTREELAARAPIWVEAYSAPNFASLCDVCAIEAARGRAVSEEVVKRELAARGVRLRTREEAMTLKRRDLQREATNGR